MKARKSFERGSKLATAYRGYPLLDRSGRRFRLAHANIEMPDDGATIRSGM